MVLLRRFVTNILKCFGFQVIPCRNMLKNSINHIINKKVMDRYLRLPIPPNKVMATYIWIDGSGINLRAKDKILPTVPYSPDQVPEWAFDGSSTGFASAENSDTKLIPVAVCKDPFRMAPHVLVLCEVFLADGKPAPTNHRKYCNTLMKHHKNEEPWFGFEQEYTMLDVDGWPLGWPKGGGYPTVKHEYSYCGVGAKYMAGREISEAHARACLYSELDFEGTNAEVMHASWEWQIGTSYAMKGPDDLWLSRYIMCRVAEEYGVQISFNPKPMGIHQPGIGVHHNFSTKRMRSDGGFHFIMQCVKRLEQNHMKHMVKYGNDVAANKMRLSGRFETAPFDEFSAGVASRAASIRIQRSVEQNGKGFFEDRRPAGDCDPYLVCGLLLETCLGSASDGGTSDQ